MAGGEVYRKVPALARPPGPEPTGPLRIVVAVAGPDGIDRPLDHEAELSRIMAAVEAAARDNGVVVTVVPWGSTGQIRRALAEGPVHALHISCHAGAGSLQLEDDGGAPRAVDAKAFAA